MFHAKGDICRYGRSIEGVYLWKMGVPAEDSLQTEKTTMWTVDRLGAVHRRVLERKALSSLNSVGITEISHWKSIPSPGE